MKDKLLGARYRVVEILAGGGFGQTYVAEDTHRPGNPKCVLKHLKSASNDPSFLESARRLFRSEAETLEKLGNHDQIPRLLAYFEENQEFYLVQDFIQGHLLSAELQPGQRWTESQVCQLLQEVLNILVFVHSQGVIHRDIKPSNLIRRHQDSKLVLVDFGSVKQAWTQVVTAQGKTSTTFAIGIPATIAIGTPGYMPVEQERGRPRPNSDIYALGMIGIQALTGSNPTQLLENSDTGDLIWQHQAHVGAALASVLTKMVRYHFKDRYQTAAEVLQALQLANLQLPTKLGSDAEAPPVQQPSMPGEGTGEAGEDLERLSTVTLSPGFTFFPCSLLLPHSPTLFAQPTVLFPQPSQDRAGQNISPVALANPLVTPANSQASSPSASICLALSPLPTATNISSPQPIVLSPLKPQAPSPSQKVIPAAHTKIVKGAGAAGELGVPSPWGLKAGEERFSFFVVRENNQHRLLIWARIAAALISVLIGYTIYWQVRPSVEKTLEQIETLLAEGKYEECVNQAKTVPQNSRFYTYTQALLHECQLAQATRFAAQHNFKAAITEASKISQDAAYHQDAQQLIAQWSENILEIATNNYQSGKLNDAIAIAKAIPETSPIYQKAQSGINQWSREWEKNNSYFTAAQKALDEGRWKNALSEAKQVIDTPYWQERIKPIIQTAESKIAASKTAVISQPRRTRRRPTRTTPRRLTRTTPRRPTRATRRSTRTTARRSTRTTPTKSTRTTPRRLRRSAPPKPSYTWTTETVP